MPRVTSIPVLDRAAVLAAVSPAAAIEAVRDAFLAHHRGEWTMPSKVYLQSPPHGDFRAMPALGGELAMLKWISSFPGNPAHGLPSVMGVVVVSDARTSAPLMLLDAGAVTALREEFPAAEVGYQQGCEVAGGSLSGLEAAVAEAEASDVVLLAVGDRAGMFGGGGRGGGGGGMPDFASIMQNPMFANMAQSLMSNPDMMANLMSNPRLREMANSFGGGGGGGGGMPDMSALMSDPNIAEM